MGKNNNKTWLYFAYGSNLNKTQMAMRCPTSIPKFRAKLFGARLVFKTYADVKRVDTNRARTFIMGAVYEITKEDMKALDYYEGFPTFYKKVNCRVMDDYGKVHQVFMYIMQPKVRKLELPTEHYLNICHDGFQDWGINPKTLFAGWEWTQSEIERRQQAKLKRQEEKLLLVGGNENA